MSLESNLLSSEVTKGALIVIEYDGEVYMTVSEVAKRFNISRATCCSNILQQVQDCYLPGRKKALYRRSDIEQFSQVRTIEKTPPPLTLVARREA